MQKEKRRKFNLPTISMESQNNFPARNFGPYQREKKTPQKEPSEFPSASNFQLWLHLSLPRADCSSTLVVSNLSKSAPDLPPPWQSLAALDLSFQTSLGKRKRQNCSCKLPRSAVPLSKNADFSKKKRKKERKRIGGGGEVSSLFFSPLPDSHTPTHCWKKKMVWYKERGLGD